MKDKNTQRPDSSTQKTADLIASIEYQEPPAELVSGIMNRIQEHKKGPLKSLLQWLFTPKPLNMAPALPISAAAAVLVMILFLGPAFFPEKKLPGLIADTEAEKSYSRDEMSLVNLSFKGQAWDRVAVIGSFNDWQPEGFEMTYDPETSIWSISIPLEPGTYEYAFMVDGNLTVPDPQAVLQKNDGFGNRNSVLFVENHENKSRKI